MTKSTWTHSPLLWYYCPDKTLTASTMALHLLQFRTSVFQPSSPAFVVSPNTSTGLLWRSPFTTTSLRLLHHLSWFCSANTVEGSEHETVMTQPQTWRTRVPSSTRKLFKTCLEWVGVPQSRWSLIGTIKILSLILRQTSKCRRIRIVAKSAYWLHHAYLRVSARLPLDGFSWNLILQTSTCRETPNLVNIEQYWAFWVKSYLSLYCLLQNRNTNSSVWFSILGCDIVKSRYAPISFVISVCMYHFRETWYWGLPQLQIWLTSKNIGRSA